MTSAIPQKYAVPAPDDLGPGWAIGYGFNPVTGTVFNRNALVLNQDVTRTPASADQSYSTTIFTQSDLSASLSYSEKAGGGAFGTSAKESMSVQAAASAEVASVVMQYWDLYTLDLEQVQDLSKILLTDEALSLLTEQGFAAFCATYGTYFIQGFTYGAGVFLNYSMYFQSVAAQLAFSAQFSESIPLASASQSIDGAVAASNTTQTAECTKAEYGWTVVPAFTTVDDMEAIAQNFQAAAAQGDVKGNPVTAWVVAYAALPAVQDAIKESYDGVDANFLAMLQSYTDLEYVAASAASVVAAGSSSMFAGGSQFAAVSSVMNEATADAQEVQSQLDSADSTGTPISDATVQQWNDATSDVTNSLTTEANRFTLNWSVYYWTGSELAPLVPNTNGNLPKVTLSSSEHVEVAGSCYVNWPDGDAVAIDLRLCKLMDGDGNLTGYAVCRLDRNAKTVQAVFQSPEGVDSPVGDVLVVAGSKNTASTASTPTSDKSVAAMSDPYEYITCQVTAG